MDKFLWRRGSSRSKLRLGVNSEVGQGQCNNVFGH